MDIAYSRPHTQTTWVPPVSAFYACLFSPLTAGREVRRLVAVVAAWRYLAETDPRRSWAIGTCSRRLSSMPSVCVQPSSVRISLKKRFSVSVITSSTSISSTLSAGRAGSFCGTYYLLRQVRLRIRAQRWRRTLRNRTTHNCEIRHILKLSVPARHDLVCHRCLTCDGLDNGAHRRPVGLRSVRVMKSVCLVHEK